MPEAINQKLSWGFTALFGNVLALECFVLPFFSMPQHLNGDLAQVVHRPPQSLEPPLTVISQISMSFTPLLALTGDIEP